MRRAAAAKMQRFNTTQGKLCSPCARYAEAHLLCECANKVALYDKVAQVLEL